MKRTAPPKTAAIIIIGNEILSAKVKDINSHYLSKELRALGVSVKSIEVIPDEIPVIAGVVSKASKAYDYVFTAGGVGPTHDDLTIEAIAKGFGLKTIRNEVIAGIIRLRCGERPVSRQVMKMAYLPDGAEVISAKGMRFPVIALGNVYIFPGIPKFLRRKFALIKNRFKARPFYLKEVYVNEEECFIAPSLNKVVKDFPHVAVGSYPNVGAGGYRVKLTLESTDNAGLAKAHAALLKMLPREVVVVRQRRKKT